MPVNIAVLKDALGQVKVLYKSECETAKREKCQKPGFNKLIRVVVRGMTLSDDERADLIHELAVIFGRRGGKAPREMKAERPKWLKDFPNIIWKP